MRRVFSRLQSLFVALVALAVVACAGKDAATRAPHEASAAAGDGEDLQARLARLGPRLERAMEEYRVPGMAIAVVRGDEVIYRAGFGVADRETNAPVEPETLFAIGSATKAFTATLVGMLVAEGKLGWDDPLHRHVPELKLNVEGEGEATLRDALSHRTGFPRMSLLWIGGQVPREEIFVHASKAEPTAKLRETFRYNNLVYMAAGEASGRAAGMSWETLVKARLLEPLGMSSATVSIEQARADARLARGYQWEDDEQIFKVMPMRDLGVVAPAGAIVANVDDMSRWLRLQLGRGTFEGRALVDAKIVEKTWTPQIDVVPGQVQYGLGWFVRKWRNHRLIEHGGNIDGYAAQVAMLPDQGLGFVLLTNVTETPLQMASIEIVFDTLLGEPKEASEEDLSPYVGTYVANFATFRDTPFTVTEASGKLFVDVPGQLNFELEPPGPDGKRPFSLTNTIAVSFDPPEDGKSMVLRLYQAGAEFEAFRQGYTPPAEVPLEELAPLRGEYENEAGTFKITVVDNRLALDIPKQGLLPLRRESDGTWVPRPIAGPTVHFEGAGPGGPRKMIIGEGEKTVECSRNASHGELPTVDALLERKRVDAFGRALAKAGVIQVRGRVKVPQAGIEGRAALWFDAEGRSVTLLDFGRFGWVRDVLLGDRAWSESSLSPTDELKGDHLAQARQRHPAVVHGDWRRAFDTIEVNGVGSDGGRSLVHVKLHGEGLPPVSMAVDAKTGDVLRLDENHLTHFGTIPTSWEYGDYRKVHGIRFPHRMKSSTDQTGEIVVEVESVEALRTPPGELFPTRPGEKLDRLVPAQ